MGNLLEFLPALTTIVGIMTVAIGIAQSASLAFHKRHERQTYAKRLHAKTIESMEAREGLRNKVAQLDNKLDLNKADHAEFKKKLAEIENALNAVNFIELRDIAARGESPSEALGHEKLAATMADIEMTTRLIHDLLESGLAEKVSNDR